MSANKQTIAEARRLCATIQLELKARTFDYAKRCGNGARVGQRSAWVGWRVVRVGLVGDACGQKASFYR